MIVGGLVSLVKGWQPSRIVGYNAAAHLPQPLPNYGDASRPIRQAAA